MQELSNVVSTPVSTVFKPFQPIDIMASLPHRYPFLLVDKVVELTPRERIVCIKNVSFNEPFFQGHFPNRPVFPGVLIIEAMAQAGGVLLQVDQPKDAAQLMVFAAIERAKFKRLVKPGDQLSITATVLHLKTTAARFQCEARVDGDLACEATLMCYVIPDDEQ